MARSPSLFVILSTAGLSLALASCGAKAPPGAPPPPVPYAEALLYDSTGRPAGVVTLAPANGALQANVQVTGGVTPGPHGIHIHAVGECKRPDFVTAGAHHNPTGKQHGSENPMGPHQGDLPILTADSNGRATASFPTQTTLDAIFDADGSSFIVHADADDMKTDPTGNSGARVLCGVFYRKLRPI
jgi:Cu-Zn family superoxide dismutase